MAAGDNCAVEVIELAKQFPHSQLGSLDVIRGLNFSVQTGEHIAFLGPSGSGKSSLLKIIAGLLIPTSGSVHVFGRSSASELIQSCAIVFQDPCLLPWRNVSANITLPLEIKAKKDAANDIQKAVDMVGLAGFERSYPRELSGGMRSRTSLARALVDERPILLLDEPFGSLDEVTRWRLNEEVRGVFSGLQRTIVIVTHSVEEACHWGDRICVLSARPMKILHILANPLGKERTKDMLDSMPGLQVISGVRRLLYGR